MREVIAETLESRGWLPIVAEDGQRGVDLAKSELPDLILCDIRMPVMDGYTVLQELRKDPRTATTPFIFLTGLADKPHMRQGMELGADDYLLKPFTIQELIGAVETRLKKAEQFIEKAEEKLSELRDSLTFALPHELRTPLSSILGFSEALITSDDLASGEVKEFAQTIHQSAKRLERLIEKFLFFAQLEMIASDKSKCAALRAGRNIAGKSVIENAALRVAHENSRARDLKLEISETNHPIADSHLERIVRELAENAFKFSPPSTPVTVAGIHQDHQFTLVVSDEGTGLSPEQIRSVSANVQFDRRMQEQQGAGLGLAIVRRLADIYGGAVVIESDRGKPTRVQVALPL